MQYVSPIQEVPVIDTVARFLRVRSVSLGPPPSFYWELSNTENGPTLVNGNASMTDEEWNAWNDSESDSEYILACVAKQIPVVVVPDET